MRLLDCVAIAQQQQIPYVPLCAEIWPLGKPAAYLLADSLLKYLLRKLLKYLLDNL